MATERKIYTVEDYKNYLGAGQRGNMYKIDFTFPAAIPNVSAQEVFNIMCEEGTMPGERPITPIPVPYEGDYIKVAGDKEATADLPFKFKNSELNMFVRKQLRLWSQLIQTYRTGVKNPPSIYKTDSFYISLLDYKKEVIEKVQLVGAFILTVNDVSVGMGGFEITTTDITITMDDYKLIV